MQNDELTSSFMEGLFTVDEEKLIVRRLLESVEEFELIDQLLCTEPEGVSDD